MGGWTRRQWIGQAAGVSAIGASVARAFGAASSRRFRIGACDWSIGKQASPDALSVAKDIGLDGVQVSLGTEKDEMHLARAEVQAQYKKTVAETGVAVASLAIGEMNRIPFKSDVRTIEWVSGSVDACAEMGCKVVLLAFFSNGDLKGDKAGTDEVVRRLKGIAPKAEKAGVVLGIESWLNADEHLDIIQRVGSPAVQIYYDVANMEKMGYDLYSEIRRLGKEKLICEVHAKENGFLLGQGKVDFRRVREALDEAGYSGWVQIEGAVPKGAAMLPSHRDNLKFLRGVLG
ncbi:MAG TPA: sugar phosphate isomerase/epimerase family protein [Verrucomicrobiae bacterium]|nr:sugar phosphate isomerase/epimerase family protein [Verrucomicrobiae bacterium]